MLGHTGKQICSRVFVTWLSCKVLYELMFVHHTHFGLNIKTDAYNSAGYTFRFSVGLSIVKVTLAP